MTTRDESDDVVRLPPAPFGPDARDWWTRYREYLASRATPLCLGGALVFQVYQDPWNLRGLGPEKSRSSRPPAATRGKPPVIVRDSSIHGHGPPSSPTDRAPKMPRPRSIPRSVNT
jgi:hypothetical protein